MCLLVFAGVAESRVKLPRLIGDGMVLQRDANVKIWGWAAPKERVVVLFRSAKYHTAADDSGGWQIQLPQSKAGGPYTMVISASDTTTINNIYIGDVWICSGQSNMELPVKRVRQLYEADIVHSDNPAIRCFTVPQKYNFTTPQADFRYGSWIAANPKTVLDFSAVAYFYAQALYEKYRVPIGLINASLGGSPAESWVSEGAIKSFPDLDAELQRYKDSTLILRTERSDRERIQAWYALSNRKDQGHNDTLGVWSAPSADTTGWESMNIPGYWAETKLGPVNGIVWFKKEFSLPSSPEGKPAKFILGRIVDADSVFVNGVCVGTTSYQYPPRRYDVPSGILKDGKNTIVVRVISNSGKGGFVLDKPYQLTLGSDTLDLRGEWRVRLGAVMEPLASETFIRWKPVGLYNCMIAPLLNYRMKGVIWYQGESNAERPAQYRKLLPALIADWREKWKEGAFPFLLVQLPNFMDAKNEPSESNWALLREAQAQTLSLPRTGMAVAIDLGEWNDIHPLNKKDVGRRLALAAEKIAYNDKAVEFSGPMYRSIKITGKKAIVRFSHTGGGLITKRGTELKGFAIAGADKKFVWAHAKIVRGTVVVWSDAVASPQAVRYAWADNPATANLYNQAGLPAAPFRTDEYDH
jgi:sialate O-acetylesterase